MVKTDDDQLTGDEKVIREKFVTYFKDLYCPSLNGQELEMNLAREQVFELLNQNPQPKIPNSAHQLLVETPSMHEIRRAVFTLGPDKSPGPDGLTARFIQQNWKIVGPEICTQVRSIFLNEEIPRDWLRCRVTLIPKSEEPLTPAEFRPISVGNILYRLVMKIIAIRLQPCLKTVIAQEQNAFVRGRCIADNIILVKEILHSFSLTKFKQKAFMLKADVNKAFDKLNWQFLTMAMAYLNIPQKIINIVVSSYSRAQVTININGRGDGFLTPTQGLRQGCPMSPYVFIISMEILSRMLKGASQRGLVKGVKVAATGPVITHAIYADDLVIMGATDDTEVQTITSIMQIFGSISGLHINPMKSRLWFSRSCNEQTIQMVQQAWGAREVEGEEKYLGVFLNRKGDIKRNGRVLLEKLKAKLTGWKAHMLSHAGRLVLIKSVLMSMPVYAMSLELLPKHILNQINSLLAKFFWGKTGSEKYMSFIAWKKICKPLEEGGLGVKNLGLFGEALFLKLVWQLMADENKLWVQICKAKYFPIVGFWRAKKNSGSSRMWGQVLNLRHFFKEQVQWRIGDGEKVQALAQPWFANWTVQEEASQADRKLKVCDMWDNQNNCWKMDELARLFHNNQVQQIIAGNNKPDVGQESTDKLIWCQNIKGAYTVKEGYKEIVSRQEAQVIVQNFDWHQIWKWKKLIPKLKVFLWRLIHKGLPLATNMHRRLHSFPAVCQRCGRENEFEMHCLFFCETSRQVWFGSALGVRVNELPLDITQTIAHAFTGMDEDGVELFVTTLWEIWKARNKAIFEHEEFQPRKVLQRINVGVSTGSYANTCILHSNTQEEHERYDFYSQGWQVLTDASWQVGGKSGGAYVVYDKGRLHSVGMHFYMANDPFHAEAVALIEAMEYMYDYIKPPEGTRVQLFSDCFNLVQAIRQTDISDLPSWRAFNVVQCAITRFERLQGMATIHHVKREAVKQSHALSNIARRNNISYRGQPHMALEQQAKIERVIDEKYFQRVQEAPP
ncbi:hypothetical protein LUZ61_004708 [Rhynchospora tenuis]|uniref:Reverse transcriptase domain-containing protein n=1 Tax=Rhynchospora tenuis TaxID=198213 RepID=A0AAD5ZNC3_9POAL|nr:hypothetical protein LUZ61_004708 [Rhynchospora tenuis]